MSEMSAAEAATVARFEAGEPAPESWRGDDGLREATARTLYEADCAYNGDSGVPWVDHLLGREVLGLRDAYRKSADAVLALPEVAALRAKAAAADRVLRLADELHKRGRVEVAAWEAENDREWAARHEARAATYARAEHLVRRALDGEPKC